MKVMKMKMSSSKAEEEAKRRRPPSPDDERKYLSMRERIKQEIRKRRNTLSNSVEEHGDNYGSFFGPSKTHIAKRVIEESKSLLAKVHLPLLTISNSNVGQKKMMVSTGTKTRSIPLLNKEQYMEVQKLRDYSFLFSDDGDPPAPAKSVKVVDKNADRNSNTRCEGRKSTPAHAVLRKSTTSVLKPHRDSRSCNERPKDLPSRNSGTVMEKKRVKQTSPHVRPKKRTAAQIYDDDDYENAKALSMIRRMFNTQRFADRDDGDCIMEASFHEIMKEERRSAKIARREDQEQLRLIAEEEQMRKSAKK